jgi:hypothetical protein
MWHLNVVLHDEGPPDINLGRIMEQIRESVRLREESPPTREQHVSQGTLDQVLGHRRRYTTESPQQLAKQAGFSVRETVCFNRTGWPAWWLNGKVLGRRTFGLGQILALNALTLVFRRVDKRLPFPPLSLIAVLEPMKNIHCLCQTDARCFARSADREERHIAVFAWLWTIA